MEISLRHPTRRALLAGIALGLGGCTRAQPMLVAGPHPLPLARLDANADRITHITVCLRPFRAAGPRLDVETIGAKKVVHNYGHGGSGWSLSWGSAALAAARAMELSPARVAVIGCGAIGITTALTLQRRGIDVVIYAAERLPESRSARATGTWSPSSRIADLNVTANGFEAGWEAMARSSLAAWQARVGLAGNPVVWTRRYTLFDGAGQEPEPPLPVRFAHLDSRIADALPPSRTMVPGSHPFPVARARQGLSMQFNIAELGRQLMAEFIAGGGRIIQRQFNAPNELATLAEPVIVNCTGFGAQALWGDKSLVPVRGQIAWLAAQPELDYGLYYRQISMLPRPEGIVIQNVGANDMWGYGDASEVPDRNEAEAALARLAPLWA